MWAGKDTIAEQLAQDLGVPLCGVSNVLREMATERGLGQMRDDLRKLSNEHGTVEQLAEILLDRLSPVGMLVGIRIPELYQLLQTRAKVVLLWVEAPDEVRMQRIIKRNKPGDPQDLPSLLEFEAREYKFWNKLNIDQLRERNDYTIDNSWDLVALEKELEKAKLRLQTHLTP